MNGMTRRAALRAGIAGVIASTFGDRLLDLAPDADRRQAIGPNPADYSRVGIVSQAGLRPGSAAAEQLRAFWS